MDLQKVHVFSTFFVKNLKKSDKMTKKTQKMKFFRCAPQNCALIQTSKNSLKQMVDIVSDQKKDFLCSSAEALPTPSEPKAFSTNRGVTKIRVAHGNQGPCVKILTKNRVFPRFSKKYPSTRHR